MILLKYSFPYIANLVKHGDYTRDQGLVSAIMIVAQDVLQENVPELMNDIASRCQSDRKKFEETATYWERVVAAVIDFNECHDGLDAMYVAEFDPQTGTLGPLRPDYED